jgi:hypothetical protein
MVLVVLWLIGTLETTHKVEYADMEWANCSFTDETPMLALVFVKAP